MIEGLKGTTSNKPSAPRTRRTATSVNGDISSIATLIKRNDAPHSAASANKTRYSLSFTSLTPIHLKTTSYHIKPNLGRNNANNCLGEKASGVNLAFFFESSLFRDYPRNL